jgi:virginiamycin B lyase
MYPNEIGRISPTGTLQEFPLADPYTETQGITAGPDGNLGFTEESTGTIGVLVA